MFYKMRRMQYNFVINYNIFFQIYLKHSSRYEHMTVMLQISQNVASKCFRYLFQNNKFTFYM